MTTATGKNWHWQDHWHLEPPPGWDGRHVLAVRGNWQNCDAAGVTLVCSCGRELDAVMPADYGEDGRISLDSLNELAAAHVRDPDVPAPLRSCCQTPPGSSHRGTCDLSVMRSGRWNP